MHSFNTTNRMNIHELGDFSNFLNIFCWRKHNVISEMMSNIPFFLCLFMHLNGSASFDLWYFWSIWCCHLMQYFKSAKELTYLHKWKIFCHLLQYSSQQKNWLTSISGRYLLSNVHWDVLQILQKLDAALIVSIGLWSVIKKIMELTSSKSMKITATIHPI